MRLTNTMKTQHIASFLLGVTVASWVSIIFYLLAIKPIHDIILPEAHAQTPLEDPVYDRQEALEAFLDQRGIHALEGTAKAILALPRWEDALAIAGAETSFCTAGVGASRNNCGAIKNRLGEFKVYASPLDSIEDISILLEQTRYKGKTIAEINGSYCVEEGGGPCLGWTERVESIAEKIRGI